MEKVVIVESPAKAKTIGKYLGDGYRVVASVGHIRDLPPKDGSVDPENDFEMKWEVSSRSSAPITDIRKALKGAGKLILATDPDREGEAISWHVLEVMNQKKALDSIPVERVVFNEITKSAILDAMRKPREINSELVEAYLARRALDYLVGFSISPLLWRKLPGARSAGRVQSVALKLICEREAEIEAFEPVEYWTVEASIQKEDGGPLTARLTHLDGRKLGKHDIADEAAAMAAVEAIKASSLEVREVETRRVKRNPQAPFTTSTMQQEASRKLGFSASRTMRVAQKLYEGVNVGSETTGLITYMRTDGVQLGQEAITDIRKAIVDLKGDRYLPVSARAYKTKAANAQEAHEAIRPTDITRKPEDIAGYLDDDQRRLYELVWRRAIASQMQSAEIDQTGADIVDRDGKATLRATGSVVVFDGFLSVYREGTDNGSKENGAAGNGSGGTEEDSRFLPPRASGEPMRLGEAKPEQHFTQPPPRYTDASLVKRMEELGIGRPSTYSSIISVLQDRDYVVKDRGRFIPEERGRIVDAFLESFFDRYVEYGFTARLEEDLDRISDGKLEWKALLADFWKDFKPQVDSMMDLPRPDVLNEMTTLLQHYLFPAGENGKMVRDCPSCQGGVLGLQAGRAGAFIGCSNYPECKYTRAIGGNGEDAADGALATGDKLLGTDPESGTEVWFKKGPYGLYVQLGGADMKKPKRCSLPKEMVSDAVDLAVGLALLALPRDIGNHPGTGEMIAAGIGRYGPYLKYAGNYVSLPNDDTVITIGINHAVELIDQSGKTPARNLGKGENGEDVMVKDGRFGPYVQHDGVNATIPKTVNPESLTLAEALELIEKKKARGPVRRKAGGGAAKKAGPKRTGAKKAATQKDPS